MGCIKDRWRSSYLLSGHVVMVAPVSAIGCGAVLKPVIENKRREIDLLSDDLGAGLSIQRAEEGGNVLFEPLFLQL